MKYETNTKFHENYRVVLFHMNYNSRVEF